MKEKKMSRIKNPWAVTIAMLSVTSATLLGCTMPNGNVEEPSTEPPAGKLLTLSGDSSASGQNKMGAEDTVAEGMPASEDMLWVNPVNYIYLPDESLSKEKSTGDGYQILLDKSPEDMMNVLARMFQMDSENIVNNPYEFDEEYYALGDWENYQQPVITYYHSGNGYWSYSNPTAYDEPNYPETEACYIAGSSGSGSSDSASSDGADRAEEPSEEELNIVCETREWEMSPPADLPSAAEAERTAKRIFAPLYGDDVAIRVDANEWSVSASGSILVDGEYEAGLSFGISWFGADVSYAYGTNASWKKISNLPLVSAYETAKRASDYRWWGWDANSPSVVFAASDAAVEPAEMGVFSGIAEESPTIEPEPPVREAPNPGLPEIEDVDVYLVNPTSALLTVWAGNGDMWLLPGFTFETGEDLPWMRVSIISVDESLIDLG